MSERAVPYHCPYCGEEDLEPYEGDGGWYCRSCARAFRVRFLGVGVRSRPEASWSPRRDPLGSDAPDRPLPRSSTIKVPVISGCRVQVNS